MCVCVCVCVCVSDKSIISTPSLVPLPIARDQPIRGSETPKNPVQVKIVQSLKFSKDCKIVIKDCKRKKSVILTH